MNHVSKYLGMLTAGQEVLSSSLATLSERYPDEPELRDTAKILARWTRADVEALRPFRKTYGKLYDDDPPAFPAGLNGEQGLLGDLQSTGQLAQRVHQSWVALHDATAELEDEAFEEVCLDAGTHVERVLGWVEKRIRRIDPEAGPEEVMPSRRNSRPAGALARLAASPVTRGLLLGFGASVLALGVAQLLKPRG